MINGYVGYSAAGDLLVHAEICARTHAIRWLLLRLCIGVLGVRSVLPRRLRQKSCCLTFLLQLLDLPNFRGVTPHCRTVRRTAAMNLGNSESKAGDAQLFELCSALIF